MILQCFDTEVWRRPNRGFTLIELMIVLVILSVVLVVAIPSYQTIGLRTKLRASVNEVVSSAYLARGEAIKRNAQMRMCIAEIKPGADSCEVAGDCTCKESGTWDEGWLVMDPNDTVMKYRQSVDDIRIFEEGGVHTILFQPSGVASTAANLTICRPEGGGSVEARRVIIAATGRPRTISTNQVCAP